MVRLIRGDCAHVLMPIAHVGPTIAKQQGENIASVLDAVAAVMVKLTYAVVTTDNDHAPHLKELGVSDADKARRQMRLHGVGEELILRYFGLHAKGQIAKHAINSAVATLKASTQYATLMQGVIKRVRAEFPKDSEQVKPRLGTTRCSAPYWREGVDRPRGPDDRRILH